MEQSSDKFYRGYSRVITAFAFFVFAASLSSLLIPQLDEFRLNSGLNWFTVATTALMLVYYFTFYRKISAMSPWIAAFLLCLLSALYCYNLMTLTGQLQSPWHALWWIINFASGVFGSFVMVCSAFLTTFYLVALNSTPRGWTNLDPIDIVIVAVMYGSCVLAHKVWKKYYVDQESAQISRLSGLLKSKESQTDVLLNSIPDSVAIVDSNNKITFFNPAAADLSGWDQADAVGLLATDIFTFINNKGEPIAEEHPFLQNKGISQVVRNDYELQHKNKQVKNVSVLIAPTNFNESGDVLERIAILRDVTKEREEEKRRADFISTASHEMRTPVAAIEGYLALALNDKVSQIDSKAKSYLEKAHTSTQALGKLFQDLLTSAKAEDGRLTSHPVVTDMVEYLKQLSEDLQFAAQKKNLLAEFVIGAPQQSKVIDASRPSNQKVITPLYYAFVDPDRLREVITNLFDNAVKYTESGKVTIGLTGDENIVQIRVADTGPGIPAQDIPHLFQKFYRVDNSATRTIGGTGLGLFICKKIVELYQGRIWATSAVGEGSTFFINLPRLSTDKAQELRAKEAATGSNTGTVAP